MDPSLIPPDAWDMILKSGNAVSIILAVLFWRNYERTGAISQRLAVLEALFNLKGKTDDVEK